MRSYVYAGVSARTGGSSFQEFLLPEGAGAAVAVACG
jgi:hypothetical protein